ncbi:MAG TPA: carbohydrate porin [Oligoflexus sp.]|uniref:carbohydrate porin n=1 Tax=Oligoflexus sp. TaxID=1971216 RepID=UPI002D7E473C|nr:carbohydrate porin [Oligoflexus sp.]HET9240606.1 carbohydrate porin [Oligoflexus sp.]
MKQISRLMMLGGLTLSAQAFSQEWSFTPEIYSRGGVTYKSDFSKEQGPGNQHEAFNLGPYNTEGLIDYPLTEVTLHAGYGDNFKFHYGFDVAGNRRFLEKNETKSSLNERVVYGEFKVGNGWSVWYGNRPFRSPPEFLSRSFYFDERNILGGGVRVEGLGPLNVDLAYGSKVNDYAAGADTVQENQNILINKIEYPLQNGAIKTNLEWHKTDKNVSDGDGELSSTGYLIGAAYQRWGDQVLGGGLYNQLVVQTSKGYIGSGAMSSAFQPGDDQKYDDAKQPSKLLVGWNGDWKASGYGVYWLALYQDHRGEAPDYSDSEMSWRFIDGMIRPVYALTPNVTVGAELDRRSVLKEGRGLRDGVINGTNGWATNSGATRWGGIISYNLENKMFDYPTIGIYAGEIIKDKTTTFFTSESPRRSTHFVRFYYEVKIN